LLLVTCPSHFSPFSDLNIIRQRSGFRI